MGMFSVRNACCQDAVTFQQLVMLCAPLEIHTEYTYWVCAHYFAECSFILENDGKPIGYLMGIENHSTVFIWQIGIVEEYRKKDLSKQLLNACLIYAKSQGKNIELTISEGNLSCYSAVNCFCQQKGLTLQKMDDANIMNAEGGIYEVEIRYRICINSM